jgi:hypothetical protein
MTRIDGEITLAEATLLLPTKNGKKFHVDSLKRWIHRGRRGVRLQAWRRGNQLFTSAQALEVFRQQTSGDSRMAPRSNRELTVAAARAREALRRKGFYGRRQSQIGRQVTEGQEAEVSAL